MSKEFRLAEIISDGMVLQRDEEIRIFGESICNDTIRVEIIDENGEVLRSGEAMADADGEWIARMEALPAATNLCVLIASEQFDMSVMLEDVAVGDVWIAGGQSNMEFFNKYEKHWNVTKEEAANLNIRMYNVPQRSFEGHTTHNHGGYGYWFKDHEDGYEVFSAAAYHFARKVQPEIGVVVGLVGCNWGGSTASAWVPERVLEREELTYYLIEYAGAAGALTPEEMEKQSKEGWEFEDDPVHYAEFEPLLYGGDREDQFSFMKTRENTPVIPMGPYHMNRPSGLFYNMLRKIIPYGIKGVLWYQGESDCGDRAKTYDVLLSSMIKCWRREFKIKFPFIMVQLAPYGLWLDCSNENYNVVRQKQQQVADTLDGVYMASIMDLGDYIDIHPKEKKEVGRRLALLALGHVYGKDVVCDAPRAVSAVRKDNKIEVSFENAETLVISDSENDLFIKTKDKCYNDVAFNIDKNKMIIDVPDEVSSGMWQVGFGYDDYAVINVHNEAGLAVAPFLIEVQ